MIKYSEHPLSDLTSDGNGGVAELNLFFNSNTPKSLVLSGPNYNKLKAILGGGTTSAVTVDMEPAYVIHMIKIVNPATGGLVPVVCDPGLSDNVFLSVP